MKTEIYFEPPNVKDELIFDLVKLSGFILIIIVIACCAFCGKV